MFFAKKQLEQQQLDSLQAEIAAFFELPERYVKSWIESKGKQLTVDVPFVCGSRLADLEQRLKGYLSLLDLDKVKLTMKQHVAPAPTNNPPILCIKNVIAVASGKGGVGKSTTAVNLAFALQQLGAKVGMLDADIYGPSLPIMLGNKDLKPDSEDGRHMTPIESNGIVANSIGYLVPAEDATIWRGPMASKALEQILMETAWPQLDYLIVDMPPGTGDIQLTLSKSVPVSGAVIVTTPQDIALADALKGIAMFKQVDVPVLGLVENMSYYQCRKCGHKEALFATEGGVRLAKEQKVNLLGQLPLDVVIREHADSGKPLVINEPDSPLTQSYLAVASAMSKQLYVQSMQPTSKIQIQNV
ncbi:iron-sulfur cluster carrier protein ApbC [Alteromonadaceae bacterium BrNp21-10]|nr:iron-sulfur cluster carrier protein ApbC [Alteromonadaceae bacterium BrNp21-10]